MKRLISLILMLTLLASCGESGSEVEAVPNEQFGMVEDIYSLTTAIPIDDCEGDTDLLTVDAVYLTQPNSAYSEYLRPYNPEDDALTLNLAVTVAEGFTAGLTSRQYDNWKIVEQSPYDREYEEGVIEKLVDGEWTVVAGLNMPKGEVGNPNVSTATEPFAYFTGGTSTLSMPFPIHESGEYRITYRFRECVSSDPDKFVYSTGAEQYSVTHTLTIPEPSEKKFDLLSLSFAEARWDSRYCEFAALIRSNDGTIPYQDLVATRLEVSSPNGWTEAPASDYDGYGFTAAVVGQYDPKGGQFSSAAYPTEHPFTEAAVENLFCGTAKFAVADPSLLHRLTLEFVENEDGSGERYVLQLNLDLSQEDEQ